MPPIDNAQTVDATPIVIRLLKHQATGILCEGLLSSHDRPEFEALLASKTDKASLLSRAGSLLIGHAHSDINFRRDVAIRLARTLGAIFWVEVGEQLIRSTSCGFWYVGEFKRFNFKISFVPRLLSEPQIPSMPPEVTTDFGLDALCRLAMKSVQDNAENPKLYSHIVSLELPLAAAELLVTALTIILPALNPQSAYAASYFSSALALAAYYVWAFAFDMFIRSGNALMVKGIGSFTFVAGAVTRVDFVAEKQFEEFIRTNVLSDLPGARTSPAQAA
jgi:hypothetical protein